ncbi:MAG: hypothetical protein OXL34_18495 [Gemmatimonadota bacterium]|nr:hypothetical protein [Gemmatimonadota bacterium]MDE2796811.1 hypothetical protein [Gemmatimonadota bacterium]MDE2871851.1 hypothetical protein [Gemmatimonadota bacterium]
MAHRADPARIRGRVQALTRIAVVLAFLVVSVEEACHSHEGEAGSAAECSACLLGKTPDHAARSHAPALNGPSPLQAPTPAEPRLAPATLLFSPHRSRAPPLSVSL